MLRSALYVTVYVSWKVTGYVGRAILQALDSLRAEPNVDEDNLEVIHGIGPIYARKLQQAGVHSFADLAARTDEDLVGIINPEPWQGIEPSKWVMEAKMLARGPRHQPLSIV